MRLNPWRWLWGLVPIAMLCWIAVLSEQSRIENDLRARAQSVLTGAGYGWAASSFDGRDAILTGQATEDNEPGRAHQLVRELWGVRIVDNRSELIEKADVYNWSALEREGRIRLTGFVPNDATRRAIVGVAKATFPKADIDDRMRPARGAPPRDTWLGGVSFALKNLAMLKNGTVVLEGTDLTVAGAADNAANYKTIKSALARDLPQGIRLKADAITAPLISPYTWSARLERNQLLIDGFAPSEALRSALLAAARTALPRSPIVDRMEIGDGAPETWAPLTAAIVQEIARLEEAAADLRGTQVNVAGLAATDTVAEAVKRALRERMPQSVRYAEAIRYKALAVPTFDPFRTTIEVRPGSVALVGHAPTEAAKAALTETARARLPGRTIDNRLEVGNGAPPGWQACIQYALSGLGRIGGGSANLVGRRLTLNGETTDETLYRGLANEIAVAAGTACDTSVELSLREVPEPTLTWRASRSDRQLVLDGEVPDAATRSALAGLAAQIFPGYGVVDRTRASGVAAGRWPQVATAALEHLARLRTGYAEIRGQQVSIVGEARERAVIASIHESLTRGLARGYSGRDNIEFKPDADPEAEARRRQQEMAALEEQRRLAEQQAAAARAEAEAREARRRRAEIDKCQEQLQRISRSGTILFERASADINARSHTTLDELVRALKACPAVTVEIEGHTDIEGAPDRNQRLSERRAQAVKAYLTQSGAEAGRLTAVGYGQDRPIATNDTSEGRARNRRIEFTVKQD